jgi:DNA-directed RNA polymerase subunit H (RpoH/RPB5)
MDTLLSLWKSRKTILEMLTDRTYKISKKYELSLDEFKEKYSSSENIRDDMDLIFKKNDRELDPIGVYWIDGNLGSDSTNILHNKMREKGLVHSIAVVSNKITSFATALINELSVKKIIIEPFYESALQYNISKHYLVPKHEICSDNELKRILSAYGITTNNLLSISINDAQIKWLGASKGQLIKIHRPTEIYKEFKPELIYYVYRIVK